VLVVDPTPDRPRNADRYVLVADAGANTVWKVTPDLSTRFPRDCWADQLPEGLDPTDCLPPYTVSVFATFPTQAPSGVPPEGPEFVPSSLAQDDAGHIYLGGVGSLVPGAASVVEYEDNGAEPATELDRWDGFTGINGLAVRRATAPVWL